MILRQVPHADPVAASTLFERAVMCVLHVTGARLHADHASAGRALDAGAAIAAK